VLDEHPTHGERENALQDLRRGRVQILVASSASGRSLEIADLAHVVNFDVPQVPEDYVHRLGRTGNSQPVGDVFSLMSPEEQREVAAVERFLGRTVPRVILPDFDYRRKPREMKISLGDEYFDASKRQAAGVRAAAARIAAVSRRPTAPSQPKAPAIKVAAKKPAPAATSRSRKPANSGAAVRRVVAARGTQVAKRPSIRAHAGSRARAARPAKPSRTPVRKK
jgi:superfamily II DNA/RNA helicase